MGRISRRDMLQRGALASLFAASGGPVLARGQRGGRLRIALSTAGQTTGFDFRAPLDLFSGTIGHGAVFEGLTEVGADGALTGELAHRWTSLEAGALWRFELRDDVSFHDGQPFGSSDVVASFSHMMGASPALEGVRDIQADGAGAVVIALRQSDPNFAYRVAAPELMIQPKDAIGSSIGTGLYTLRHVAPHTRVLAQRVPQHWKGDTAGFADDVEFLIMPSTLAQASALKAGAVDVASDAGFLADAHRTVVRFGDVGVSAQVRTGLGQDKACDLLTGRIAQRWWLA